MKSLLRTIAGISALVPVIAGAQVLYDPMVALPGVPEGGVTFVSYAPAIFKLVIGLGGVLAVIMIVIGGIQLIGSGANESLRSSGKEKIWNAIFGLVGMALIWIVLRLINPNLVSVDLTLEPAPIQEITPEAQQILASGTTVYWADDSAIRNELGSLPYNVSINRANCAQVGSRGCTSVHQLGQSAISGTKNLRRDCNCAITITGGTEYWLHSTNTSHRPGNSTVDLRETPDLNRYLTGSEGSPRNGTRVSRNGGTYTYETFGANSSNNGAHWHVTY